MIQKCKNKDCKHTFQDKEYGNGIRVMNATADTDGSKRVLRCTVCATEQTEK